MQFPQRFSDVSEHAVLRLRLLLEGCAPGRPEIACASRDCVALVASGDEVARGFEAIRNLLGQPQRTSEEVG